MFFIVHSRRFLKKPNVAEGSKQFGESEFIWHNYGEPSNVYDICHSVFQPAMHG